MSDTVFEPVPPRSGLWMIPLRQAARATRRPAASLLMLAACLFASTRSSAQNYATRNIGGWTVTASQDKKGCFLTKTYQVPGETTLLLGLDTDGSNRLSVLNANWSIREKERQDLDFRLSNVAFPKHFSIGIVSDGKKGFVTDFGEKFPAYFAASKFLHISRGKVPVEELALDGSGAAVTELRKCVDVHQGKPAAQAWSGDRPGHIPIDPFAPGVTRKAKK